MTIASLQALGDGQVARDIFTFEHSMAHRELLSVMAPLSKWTAYPYRRMLDPMDQVALPASDWHLNHQQAHTDAQSAVPTYYGSKSTGLLIGGDLMNYDLADEEQKQWWLLQNHFQHYVMGNSVIPFPGVPPAEPAQPLPPLPQIPWPPTWWVNQSGRYTYPFW